MAPYIHSLMPELIRKARLLRVPPSVLMYDSGDSDADALVSHALALLGAAEAEAQRTGFEHLLDLSILALADIHNSRARSTPLDSTDWDFLRLFICICPLTLSVGRGEFGLTFDWIVRSLSHATDVGHEIENETLDVGAFARILSSTRRSICLNREVAILDWAAAAFYYSRWHNTFVDILGDSVPAVIACASVQHLNDQCCVDAILQVLGWLDRYQHPSRKAFADVIAAWAARDDIHQRLKASLVMGLATRPEATLGRWPADWAQSAISDRDSLVQHEPAQMFSILLSNATSIDQGVLEELIQASLVADCTRRKDVTLEHLASVRARLFATIQPAFARLILAGRVDDAIRLIAAWRGQTGNFIVRAAIIAPLCEEVGSIAVEGEVLEAGPDKPIATLSDLLHATNRALSLQVVRNDVDDDLERADRLGIPQPDRAGEFEQAVENWLRVDRLNDRPSAFIPISVARIPLQPIMVKHLGWTSPISLSLRPPLPQSPLRSVIIWKTDLAYADEETEAIEKAFRGAGASVRVYRGAERTASVFRQIYEEDFDVLWVSGHAELDHFQPTLVYLDLGNNQQFSLAEVIALTRPVCDTQRLIILNVCDGGAAAIHAGPDEVGLSVALAGPDQAVCSHQWPVGVVSAAAFGALFAAEIGRGMCYLDAYVETITVMLGGVDEISRRLDSILPGIELIARLKCNTSVRDSWTIFDWGSAAFYE